MLSNEIGLLLYSFSAYKTQPRDFYGKLQLLDWQQWILNKKQSLISIYPVSPLPYHVNYKSPLLIATRPVLNLFSMLQRVLSIYSNACKHSLISDIFPYCSEAFLQAKRSLYSFYRPLVTLFFHQANN